MIRTNIASFPRVDTIREIESRGPWDTKSGGSLNVLLGFPYDLINSSFFNYDLSELKTIPYDIRGIRAYKVSDIPKGAIGANEWHKIRHELVFAISGSVRWTCEDIYGNKRTFDLDGSRGVWVNPYILHTYEALTEGACLLVIANTLFLPDLPSTRDTYSLESFRKVQNTLA